MTKFTRNLVKSGPGGEVYALSEMVDHMALRRAFFEPFVGLPPGILDLGTVRVFSIIARPRRRSRRSTWPDVL